MKNLNNIKRVHILGIGGCASSAIAEFLTTKNIIVTGSEMVRKDLTRLEKLGIKIVFTHKKDNLLINNTHPDIVLYSPAIPSLDPNNIELSYARELKIPSMSWQEFIGDYLNSIGSIGLTVTGSEGKGTTAGILTTILKGTEWDPLSILGAQIKTIYNNKNSNIYLGKGKSYILEGDEYNRNFYNYHPSINAMVNFKYEHPETYKNFDEYQEAFYNYFKNMNNDKILILRATTNIINFVNRFNINANHRVIWFGNQENLDLLNNKKEYFTITQSHISQKGISFDLQSNNNIHHFKINTLPAYMVYNSTAAIISAITLGLPIRTIQNNVRQFKGMVRRFDTYKFKKDGVIITDYGHSPESISSIIKEVKSIYPNKNIHIVFQPHLYSRTYNFFDQFVTALSGADKISLVDIYPAREQPAEWADKISSKNIADKLNKIGKEASYLGKSKYIAENLYSKIKEEEVTCLLGAGDMDLYYGRLLEDLKATN